MDLVTVVARETFPYAGITRRAGESFAASAEDARILRLIGKVQSDDEVVTAEEDVPVVAPHARRSRRKDIAAEA